MGNIQVQVLQICSVEVIKRSYCPALQKQSTTPSSPDYYIDGKKSQLLLEVITDTKRLNIEPQKNRHNKVTFLH